LVGKELEDWEGTLDRVWSYSYSLCMHYSWRRLSKLKFKIALTPFVQEPKVAWHFVLIYFYQTSW